MIFRIDQGVGSAYARQNGRVMAGSQFHFISTVAG